MNTEKAGISRMCVIVKPRVCRASPSKSRGVDYVRPTGLPRVITSGRVVTGQVALCILGTPWHFTPNLSEHPQDCLSALFMTFVCREICIIRLRVIDQQGTFYMVRIFAFDSQGSRQSRQVTWNQIHFAIIRMYQTFLIPAKKKQFPIYTVIRDGRINWKLDCGA